ncbi:MAG TPA: gamma-glutamyltransferase [Trueperaceae bacterium]|nr:gamma-glutamyltransferase [Trueperaceae bacterium]
MDFEFIYKSQRMPVMAENIVASSQPLAVQAGLDILRQGGNAVDAAIATAITLAVVEPTSNGIGSDAFCILWDGKELRALNASGRSAKDLDISRFATLDKMPLRGWDVVTVPGAVSAWVELSDKFGLLDFKDLFSAAINYAENGFMVSPITARAWSKSAPIFANFPEFAKTFLINGSAPKAGELFKNPKQAQTLRLIAQSKGEAFYKGELAQKIVTDAKKHHAAMSLSDLAEHKAEWVETISQNYNGIELHEIPPNGQGLAALIALGILKHHNISQYPVDSIDSLHLQIEAMKLAFADIYQYLADQEFMDIRAEDLLDEGYLKQRAKLIDMDKAQDPKYGMPQKAGTVYLTTADKNGMMVSFIQSNYHGFGSGIVIPETGISMQNRGSGFSLINGHPNQVAAGKRPFHTIIPAFVTKDKQPLISFGVMGGPMQAQGHVQMVIRIIDYNQNPQTASDAPRWQVLQGLELAIEDGFTAEVLAGLEHRGHKLHLSELNANFAFGGAQIIYNTDSGYIAASDSRKDGQAAGF